VLSGVSAETSIWSQYVSASAYVGAVSGDFRVPTGDVSFASSDRAVLLVCEVPPAGRLSGPEELEPAWTERGRPPAGYLTKRLAEDWLRSIGEDRVSKASTVEDYRSIIRVHFLPAFGDAALETITVDDVEAFEATLAKRVHNGRPITPRPRNKVLNVLHGVFKCAKKAMGASAQSRCAARAPPVMEQRRHRGLRARGGLGPGPRRRRRTRPIRQAAPPRPLSRSA
jgi:hypothetical protein